MKTSLTVYVRLYELRLDGVWFRIGPDGGERLAHEPPQYVELLDRALGRTTPALALFRTASGDYCCLANHLHTGRTVSGAASCRSILLVSRDGFVDGMLRLAAAYLRATATDLRWVRLEFEAPQSVCTPRFEPVFAPLFEPVTVTDAQVRVDWSRWVAAIGAPPLPPRPGGDRLSAGVHADTPEIRSRLASELTQAKASPGEIVALVTSGASDGRLAALGARWVLRPEPPAPAADPFPTPAATPAGESGLHDRLAAIECQVVETRRAVARLETVAMVASAITALALIGTLLLLHRT